jgi:hypothetical protein
LKSNGSAQKTGLRLGRSLFMIMSILDRLMGIGARVWTIKDNYRLGDDIQSKVLAFAVGLSAEIEIVRYCLLYY